MTHHDSEHTAARDIDAAVFISQADLLLGRARRSCKAILAGGIVFAATLFSFNTPVLSITIWFTLLMFTSLMLVYVCRPGPSPETLNHKVQQITQRTIFSCLSAFLYGITVFLLPEGNDLAVAMLFTILVVATTITVVICINFPRSYIAFDLSAMLPIGVYFIMNFNSNMLLLMLIMIVGHIAFKPMAEHLSEISRQSIKSNLLLEREVEEHIQSKQQIQHLALHDHLTGIANRRHFEDHAENLIENAETAQGSFGIIFIDLDDFKQINDNFGHKVGDEVLRTVAKRISLNISDNDFAARLGGDEFCILINNSNSQKLNQAAEKLTVAFSPPVLIDGLELNIRCSIGSARYPDNALELDTLISIADNKMYDHKKAQKQLVSET